MAHLQNVFFIKIVAYLEDFIYNDATTLFGHQLNYVLKDAGRQYVSEHKLYKTICDFSDFMPFWRSKGLVSVLRNKFCSTYPNDPLSIVLGYAREAF